MANNVKKKKRTGYENYVYRYKQKEALMAKKGYKMADTMLNKKEWNMAFIALKEEGVTKNINQTLVSSQQYQYKLTWAKQMKKVAKEKNLEWKNLTLLEIQTGKVDLSWINQQLIEDNPYMTSADRAKWISQFIFDSN